MSYPGNRCPARCRCSCRWRAVHAVCKQSCVLVHFDSVGMASYVNHEVRTRGTPLFNLHSSSSGSVVDKGMYKVVLSTPQILERFGQAYVDLFNLLIAVLPDRSGRTLWPATGLTTSTYSGPQLASTFNIPTLCRSLQLGHRASFVALRWLARCWFPPTTAQL